MAAPTDVSVVPLRVPRALAPRARVEAAAEPDDIIDRTDVDAALDVYDLCIGCRDMEHDPDAPAGDKVAEDAVGNAQMMASLALQYVEASHVALRDRSAAFETRVAEAHAKLEALTRRRRKRERRREEMREKVDAADAQVQSLERILRQLEADMADDDGGVGADMGVRVARALRRSRGGHNGSSMTESDGGATSSFADESDGVRVGYGRPSYAPEAYGRSAYPPEGLRAPAPPHAHVGGRPSDPLLMRSASSADVVGGTGEDRGRV